MIRLIACLLACLCLALPVAADRPNILLITADDMNWDSLGCFGNELKGVSPNLDQLASEGVRFEQAYVTIAICQPCRASIMTGRYPHTSGALGFDKIKKGVPTLPETLREAGYYTGVIGKASHTVPSRHKTAFDEVHNRYALGVGRSPRLYHERVAKAMKTAVDQGKPYFLNVNLHDPHRPFANAPQERRNKNPKIWKDTPLVENPYKPEEIEVPGFLPDLPEIRLEMAEYYTSVRRCDVIVGEVLKALDESGQADNTVVLFLSDHGIAVPFAKTNCWMHSNRTPLIVKWPGKTKAGAVVEERMVSSIDLAPTILDIVGLENLEGADGESFRGLFDSAVPSQGVGRDHVFVSINTLASRKEFAMRGVIMNGAYIWNGWADGETQFRNESMSGRSFKAMQEAAKTDPAIAARVKHYLFRWPEELYDYRKDPDALNNLVSDNSRSSVDSVSAGQLKLLKHMYITKDAQYQAFREYLESIDSRALHLFER